jgi:hypothetical protein
MPEQLQCCLMSNIACFYERKGDLKTAKLYQETSMQNNEDAIAAAINFNNLSVMELRCQNFESAMDAAKQAYSLIEPDLLEEMNQ